MSSFTNRHRLYLFSMRNGKKKIAYGETPEDALDILRLRLTEAEMSQVIPDEAIVINQSNLQKHVSELG